MGLPAPPQEVRTEIEASKGAVMVAEQTTRFHCLEVGPMSFFLIQLGQSSLKQLPTDLVKDQHLAPCLCPARQAGVRISKGGGLVGEHQEARGYPTQDGSWRVPQKGSAPLRS